jgi:membrane fusion protein (multidrug efflux system)
MTNIDMETQNSTASGQNKKERTGIKKPVLFVLIIVAGGIIIYFSAKYISHTMNYESSDNAQIDGNIIPLRIKTGGYMAEIRFEDNQPVKKGDTLAIVDTTDLAAQVQQAEARLESALIAVQTNHAGKQSATFGTEAADENIAAAAAKLRQAENDFKRIQAMYDEGTATPQTFDVAKSGLDMAKSQFNALTAQRESAGIQIKTQNLQIQSAEARVKEAKAQLVAAKYLLHNSCIIAPCNGIISKKAVQEGQFCLPGTAIAMLIDLDNIWVTANLKETQLDKIQPGQEVNISVDAYSDVEIRGEIESISGATGPKFSLLPADNATGNFVKVTQRVPVRIAVKQIKNEKHKQIVPGMNVIVDIKTGK